MTKIYILLATASFGIFALAGCGNTAGTTNNAGGNNTTAKTNTPAPKTDAPASTIL